MLRRVLLALSLTLATLAGPFAAPLGAATISELVAERATQDYGPALPDTGYFQIRLADGLPDEAEFIKEFWIDQDTGQFIANVITARGEIKRVWGMAVLTVPVPVVTRRLLPDEIVKPEDIRMVEMAWARVHTFAITDRAGLEGMQVRRQLVPGRPIQRQSVIPPIIISRGEKVTIELNHGPLRLSAKGKAIGDAHLGQEVRVVNLASNKTITAIARGDGLVEAQF